MNSEQLRIFLNVADYGSFSKAEENSFISKQAMFKQVSRLEDEVGCPLFIRSKTGVTLSEAGKIFYDGAKELLRNREDLITKCRQAGNHEFTFFLGHSIANDRGDSNFCHNFQTHDRRAGKPVFSCLSGFCVFYGRF
ncbi:MAG: LysR family transcriptional regulator [Solobacterium sp.]|nr:LysR family transcriptional regulator [Solobacterium sp.]